MNGQDSNPADLLRELSALRQRVALLEVWETRRRQTSELLRKERDLVAAVLNSTAALVVVLDPQRRIVRFNRACEQATGYSLFQVKGRPLDEVLLPPEEVDSFRELCDRLHAAQACDAYENVWVTKDGRRRLTAWSYVALRDEDDDVEYLVGTGVDITERRRAEEAVRLEELRLNSLLELSQKAPDLSEQEIIQLTLEEAVSLTQSQIGYLHFVNPDQETLQLYTWSQEAMKTCEAVHDAHYPLSQAGVWADCARQKKPVIHNDYQNAPDRRGYPPGHSHLVRHVSVPVLDGDQVCIILGVGNKPHDYHDADVRQMRLVADNLWRIIRRKRLESELREHVRALEEVDRQKNEFLAMLAHELRNPLAPVCHALQILSEPGASAAAIEKSRQVMGRQLETLVRLVDDLLDVSRITQGRIALQCRPVSLAEVVDHAVEISRSLIDMLGHALDVTLPEDPVYVQGDAVRLAQIVANLLNNAAKYTTDGGRIRLTVAREDSEAVIRVADDGIGIAAEMLPRIFDVFVQADRSLDRARGGLGLGLSLVRSLVELHAGSVQAFSPGEGQGSELVVRLPALQGPPAPLLKDPSAVRSPPVKPDASARILIVDDNRDAAAMLADLLRSYGWGVHVAHDGPAALSLAATLAPKIALLDIGLPEMDGYELARRLRAQRGGREPLLVAVTGYGDAASRQLSQRAGFDHHLVKPVNLDALLQLLTTSAEPSTS